MGGGVPAFHQRNTTDGEFLTTSDVDRKKDVHEEEAGVSSSVSLPLTMNVTKGNKLRSERRMRWLGKDAWGLLLSRRWMVAMVSDRVGLSGGGTDGVRDKGGIGVWVRNVCTEEEDGDGIGIGGGGGSGDCTEEEG